MINFGLIAEGVTDQVVISNILIGLLNNKDLPINPLQPLFDETDKSRLENNGGWGNLIEFLKSDQFKESFQFCDIVIIQIDTDVCEDYGVPKNTLKGQIPVNELIENVEKCLISKIGEFYNGVSDRIIFAVSVHMIECWILPLFYSDAKKSKVVGCLGTLNQNLKKSGYTIDPDNKEYEYYKHITKPYTKNRIINDLASANPSLEIFCEKVLVTLT